MVLKAKDNEKYKIYTRCGDDGYTCIIGQEKISKIHIRVETYGSVDELNSFVGLVISSLRSIIKDLENYLYLCSQDKINLSELFLNNSKPFLNINKSFSVTDNDIVITQQHKLNKLCEQCLRIQNELLCLGSQLATKFDSSKLLYGSYNNAYMNELDVNKDINEFEVKDSFVGICLEQVKQLEIEIDAMSEKISSLDTFLLPSGSEIVSRLHVARTVCRRVEINLLRLKEKQEIEHAVFPYINRLSDWLFVAARYVAFVLGEKETLWKK